MSRIPPANRSATRSPTERRLRNYHHINRCVLKIHLFFADPVSNPLAVNPAKVIIDIAIRHAYLPTLLITDKGSISGSNAIHERAEVVGITLRHETPKDAQNI